MFEMVCKLDIRRNGSDQKEMRKKSCSHARVGEQERKQHSKLCTTEEIKT
jgi:hypothetical protein